MVRNCHVINTFLCFVLSLAFIRIVKEETLYISQIKIAFPTPSSFVDIETSCLEEKNKRDHFTQLVLACLVSYT